MRVVIATSGSRGDIQPCVALALSLLDRGHIVDFIAPPNFEQFVLRYAKVTFHHQGVDTEDFIRKFKEGGAGVDVGAMMHGMYEMQNVDVYTVVKSLPIKPKVFLYHTSIGVGSAIARKFNMCAIEFQFSPWEPILSYPSMLADLERSNWDDPIANFVSHIQWVDGSFHLGGRNFCKKSIELMGEDFTSFPTHAMWRLRAELGIHKLMAWSPAFLKTTLPFPSNLEHLTGYWRIPLDKENFIPPQNLVDFLSAGSAPIYVGFGSMSHSAGASIREAVRALIDRGHRLVVSRGWGDLLEGLAEGRENVVEIGDCPHSWLFPKMALVILHGGAGTVASALSAGVPSVVLPVLADQPFWGALLHRKGIAAKPIPAGQVTASLLVEAVESILNNPSFRERAEAVAVQLESEDGPALAVEVIEAAAAAFTTYPHVPAHNEALPWEGRMPGTRADFLWMIERGLCPFDQSAIEKHPFDS